MERLRVLVVDDSLTIRAILSEVIGSEPGFVVVGLAADAARQTQELIELIKSVVHHEAVLDGEDLAAKALGARD